MVEWLVPVGAALLVALVVMGAWTLARQGAMMRDRDTAIREAADLRARLAAFADSATAHERDIRDDLTAARRDQSEAAAIARRELGERLAQFQQGTQQALASLTTSTDERLEAVRATVEKRLDLLRTDNAEKLDRIRATVDEKLQATLDQRLGESFRLVSERLEQVHKGLGEMQSLAVGVGDLKRVLSNVKTRGMWGEVQLAALLSEVLTTQQY